MQHRNDDLGPIVHANRNDAVAHAPADDHRCAALSVQPGVIPRKQALIGGNHPAKKRQAELAAVGMTAKRQLDALLHIDVKQLRPVGQQDSIPRSGPRVLNLRPDDALRHTEHPGFREIRIVHTDELDAFAVCEDRFRLIVQHGHAAAAQTLLQLAKLRLQPGLMVTGP